MLNTLKVILLWIIYMPFIPTTFLIAWLDRKLKFKLPFPRDVDELTNQQEWCIKVLKENGTIPVTAQIESYTVKPINQELIFRSNAGIIDLDYTDSGTKYSLKCFAKFAPTVGTVWNRTIFNLQLNHIKETNFNNYFVKVDADLPAPKVYYSAVSAVTGNLCLITEFMSDNIEHKEGAYENFIDEHLHLVLDGLATLHAKYWKSTEARMKYVMPIDDSTVHVFNSMVLFSWSKPARKILVQSWCYMNEYQTVLHGDSRIGNMMFPSAPNQGRYVLIDWQAVRKGRAVYDLAYFLVLSLTAEERQVKEKAAIETYYKLLWEKGVKDYTWQQAQEDYNHACLCVLVLLSLPMLSGEASAEGPGALLFAWGMNLWKERMQVKFNEFDYQWLANNYGLSEQQGRDAVAEMLNVITVRLDKIAKDNARYIPIVQAQHSEKKHEQAL